MKVVISQDRIKTLKENKEEITYFSFFTHIKNFIKQLLQNPTNATASEELKEYFGCDDKHIVEKLIQHDIIRRKNNIIETPKEVTADKKSQVHYSIQYIVPKQNFKDKIHRLFSKEILKENVENEYLDKYYGKPLYNYLDVDDERVRQNLLYYESSFSSFATFLKKYGYDEDFDEAEFAEIQERCDNFDDTLIDEILDSPYADSFLNYIYNHVISNPPTTSVMFDPHQIKKPEWLIHFSDNAKEIWEEGFMYATYDLDKLGYSDSGNIQNKENEGYCFAYTIGQIKRNGYQSYGYEAVMFVSCGVEAYHTGDEENQVMFWNKDVHNIVYLQYNDEYDWFVGDLYHFNQPFYHNEDILKVIYWVIANLPQYRKWLINPRESKNYQNNNKNSVYTTMLQKEDIHRIIRESIDSVLSEDGATTCGSVMQGGGTNPSAGQYDVPVFGNDKEGSKRSKDFANDSMMMQRLKEDWDKMNEKTNCQYRPIYKPTIKNKKK